MARESLTLRVMNLDYALRVPKPTNLTDESTSNQLREMEKWKKDQLLKSNAHQVCHPRNF